MKLSESLVLELLELTRMFQYLPYNAIFTFAAHEDKRTLDFFSESVYIPMTEGRMDYGHKVVELLDEIKQELIWLEK